MEEGKGAGDETWKAHAPADRRAYTLANELDESRTLVEHADKARRAAEWELSENHEMVNDLSE